MDYRLYYLAFSHFLPIGPIRLKKLIDHLGNAENAYKGDKTGIESILGKDIATQFFHFRSIFDPVKKEEELKKKEITFLTQENRQYPYQLLHIPDPPICLYVKGDIDNHDFKKDFCIGIVGTRKPTSYGKQIAKKLSSELSVSGLTTVSGMAMGIDAIVHRSTLEIQGKTIAILGCAVDVIYPSCNIQLYEDIIKSKGLVISEFPPGQNIVPSLFILRNRLISGLSKGILVIEGMKDSGTLITARFAAEQGKEVFAVPSPITSPLSEAPNLLLKQGAKLVTCVEDIIEEFGLTLEIKAKQLIDLNNKEKRIIHILEKEPKCTDELEVELKIPIHEILQALSILELKKAIEKNAEGKYQLAM